MKAPSVREGSKENGTQVTGNRIYKGCLVCKVSLPDPALPQDILFYCLAVVRLLLTAGEL